MGTIIIEVRSGGQTGVDRAALDAAIALGIPYAGWCPAGGWAEDCPAPPGVLALYPSLVETPSRAPEQRTEWNVRDADVTLVLATGSAGNSPGTEFTIGAARAMSRPCKVLRLEEAGSVNEGFDWLSGFKRGLRLNVAGPRESECPGIYEMAKGVLMRLLDAPDQ